MQLLCAVLKATGLPYVAVALAESHVQPEQACSANASFV